MVLRKLAGAAGLVAFALYLWGLLNVMGALLEAGDGGTDSAPPRPCRTANRQYDQRVLSVTDYSVDFVPLRFVCKTKDGGSFVSGTVPGYVNPAVFGLVLTALGCWVAGLVAAPPGPRGVRGPGG
ncbi:hypothetical protein JHN63_07770 [Streptomyces sp. MBT65]|uniref:hypothetical protein n=1 Tax=Streptomyces sp. MBT65 TaxID=1488395 RepID=UPI00190970D4|nr:hypothetical protein [Streptomyces sp. MBT65]MBK3573716.1 hypothetical protein [Streptomyces sp. MBT65]